MTKPVEFSTYESAINYPTRSICVQIDNEQGPQEDCRNYVKRADIRFFIEPKLKEAFCYNMWNVAPYGAIVESWLANSAGRVEWSLVYNKLDGRPIKREPDALTIAAYEMMQSAPWKDIVADTELRIDADQKLREWTDIQIETWWNNTSARKAKTPLTAFVSKAFEIYLGVVDWSEVHANFQSKEEEPEEEAKEETWETGEVIRWLTASDSEEAYLATLNKTARQLRRFVLDGEAPQGLYDSFNQPPMSSFEDVDWDAVEEACEE